MSCVRHLSFLPPLAAQPAQARAHAVTIANRLPLTSFADPFCNNIGQKQTLAEAKHNWSGRQRLSLHQDDMEGLPVSTILSFSLQDDL